MFVDATEAAEEGLLYELPVEFESVLKALLTSWEFKTDVVRQAYHFDAKRNYSPKTALQIHTCV